MAALAAVPACVALFPSAASAGAWTRAQGETMLLLPLAYVTADKAFNGSGDRVDRDRFEMLEFSPMVEYGFTDALTGGLQPKFRRVKVDTDSGDETNEGLAEADAFLRYRLWSQDQAAFSVQGLVKAPIEPDEDDLAALGRDQVDVELSLLYGNRRTLQSGGSFFYNGELGYRKRFKEPDDEIHLDAYVGWSTGGPWTVVLRSANTIGVGNATGTREVLTTRPSFRRHEAQLIGSYRFTPKTSGVVGVSTTFAGEDVGIGHTGFLSVVTTF
jgi:hypothetical protein